MENETIDPITEAANRLLGEILNVLDILIPEADFSQFTQTMMTKKKTQKEAAVDVIRTQITRVFAELSKKVVVK